MQLIYLYIDNYCSFQKAEFNFSQNIRIQHHPENSALLEVEDQPSRLPEQFWGENISNLNVVIGNNGAGKTSLMQYLLDLFLEAHGGRRASGQGIVIFGEADTLYGYYNRNWEGPMREIQMKSKCYKRMQWLFHKQNVQENLGRTKLIYLTNALSMRDSRRSQWYNGNRFAPLYDCSTGNLLASNIERDVNQSMRRGPMGGAEMEAYFLYEQYKQIKFVFDRRQHQICTELKKKKFPVPVPKALYIDLLMGYRLSIVESDTEIEIGMDQLSAVLDEADGGFNATDSTLFLRKQLNRCALWCAVRSILRCLSRREREILGEYLGTWKVDSRNPYQYVEIFQEIWDITEQIKKKQETYGKEKDKIQDWKWLRRCHRYYVEYFEFIESEKIEEHFRVDSESWKMLIEHPGREALTFTVETSDAEWFMKFIQKYRYICNPDYFLDFRWGLSSGENSLLSMFASFYYIFNADFTNKKNGDYRILNHFEEKKENVQCDSVILLIDEADLTYHPEWQRKFIALLTTFLPQVYPVQCCRNIQIILSTHSPILLSDVPQENVIYLKYDPQSHSTVVDHSEHTGTFGQNIHLLFKDSFFLENGTIGLFAHDKIQALVRHLKKLEVGLEQEEKRQEEQKEEKNQKVQEEPDQRLDRESLKKELECKWKPYANLIAEPIIRRRAVMWIDTLERQLSKNEKIERVQKMTDMELERELARLQAELNRRKIEN